MTDIPDDDLRARLSRLDPAPAGVPVDPVTSPRAQELVERAMSTPVQTPDTPSARRRARPGAAGPGCWSRPRRRSSSPSSAASSSSGTGPAPTAAGSRATLALELPPGDVAMSCVQFDVQFLREMPVALAGTVTALEPAQVSLDVDRWYKGGSADRVTIAVPVNNSVALDGVEFLEGERYLVTATDGIVNGCGFSGPATPELERPTTRRSAADPVRSASGGWMRISVSSGR